MLQYAVTQKDGEWTLFEGGKPVVTGFSRSATLRLAEDLAFKAEERGEGVELVVQEYSGELKERRSFSA